MLKWPKSSSRNKSDVNSWFGQVGQSYQSQQAKNFSVSKSVRSLYSTNKRQVLYLLSNVFMLFILKLPEIKKNYIWIYISFLLFAHSLFLLIHLSSTLFSLSLSLSQFLSCTLLSVYLSHSFNSSLFWIILCSLSLMFNSLCFPLFVHVSLSQFISSALLFLSLSFNSLLVLSPLNLCLSF